MQFGIATTNTGNIIVKTGKLVAGGGGVGAPYAFLITKATSGNGVSAKAAVGPNSANGDSICNGQFKYSYLGQYFRKA